MISLPKATCSTTTTSTLTTSRSTTAAKVVAKPGLSPSTALLKTPSSKVASSTMTCATRKRTLATAVSTDDKYDSETFRFGMKCKVGTFEKDQYTIKIFYSDDSVGVEIRHNDSKKLYIAKYSHSELSAELKFPAAMDTKQIARLIATSLGSAKRSSTKARGHRRGLDFGQVDDDSNGVDSSDCVASNNLLSTVTQVDNDTAQIELMHTILEGVTVRYVVFAKAKSQTEAEVLLEINADLRKEIAGIKKKFMTLDTAVYVDRRKIESLENRVHTLEKELADAAAAAEESSSSEDKTTGK